MERETRFELATFALARQRSTTEPLPRFKSRLFDYITNRRKKSTDLARLRKKFSQRLLGKHFDFKFVHQLAQRSEQQCEKNKVGYNVHCKKYDSPCVKYAEPQKKILAVEHKASAAESNESVDNA